MKAILTFVLITLSLTSFSQQAPGIAWRSINWARYTPNFAAAVQIPSLNSKGPNEYQSQDESGEDWWMDIAIARDASNNQIGYMVTGFTRWMGYTIKTDNIGGCNNGLNGQTNQYDDCEGRVVNNRMTDYVGTAAFYDLNGKMKWCKSYTLGGDAYFGIIRDIDGNYLMIGNTREVIDPNGNLIAHNPTISNPLGIDLRDLPPNFPTPGACPQAQVKRMVITKIDGQGNVIWNHTYGYHVPSIVTPQDNFDVFKLESNGYDIVEDNSTSGYVVSGVAQIPGDNPGNGQPNHLFALHIDKDGNITNHNYYGDAGSVYYPKNITSDGTSYFLTAIKDGAPFVGMVYKIEDNTSLAADWGGTTWNSGNQPVEFNNYACHDLIVHDNKLFVSAAEIMEGNCTFAGLNRGHFYFRGLDLNSGNEILSAPFPIDIVEATAFDFKSGLTETADGGIAFVTSARNPDVDEPNGTESDLDGPLSDFDDLITVVTDNFGNPYDDCRYLRETEGASYAFGVWRTDTYIAKFDAVGNKEWETTFDSDDAVPENYPGDFKEQECVYHIAEGDDGGLVIVGNTSHNHDDYYLAKVFSDCQTKAIYTEEDSFDNVIEINGVTTWPAGIYTVKGTVLVTAGAVLTIEDALVEFADTRRVGVQTKIIVKKGGKLILNNSTLTSFSYCDKAFWDGIYVEGTVNVAQSNTNQGYVVMNGGTIKNARYGITTQAVDANGEADYSKTGGGVIQVKNANFIDCYVGIEFMPYVRQVGSGYASNLSFVRNCDFKTTDLFGDQSEITKPYTFIKNYGTYNVKVQGNRFLNERDELSPSQWGNGIISMDAGYTVAKFCNGLFFNCPPANIIKNEFTNLQTGVEINQGGANNFVVTVSDAVFDNNLTGIRVNGGQFGKLINNEFVIPVPNYGSQFLDASGIYLNGTWGYRVEGNILSNRGGFISGRNNGIITVDSDNGGNGLTIYRNEFHDLMTGAETIGANTQLQIDCNQFYKSATYGIADIFHADGDLADQGTCLGSNLNPIIAQANEFFGSCDNITNLQIHKNPSAIDFDYNSFPTSDVNISPLCLSLGINYTPCDPMSGGFIRNTACPTNLVFPFIFQKSLFKSNITALSEDIEEQKNLIDGGNTQAVLTFIASNNIPGFIKNYLLSLSPYLSDEVLIATIDKNLPAGIIKQILLENSSLSEKVMTRLETYSLPQGIRNQIMAAQNGTSSMMDLNKTISFLENEKLINVNDLVSAHLDSAEVDSAILVLKSYGNKQSQCALVPIIAKKDTTSADTIISQIQLESQLELASDPNCKSCQDNLSFCDFQKLMFAINSRVGGYFSLNDFEKIKLQEISESESPISTNAHSILNFIDFNAQHLNGLDYLLPNGVVRSYQEQITEEPKQSKISVYPNPANNQFNIDLNTISDKGWVDIYDVYGKNVMNFKTLNSNRFSIDCSNFSPGLYFIVFNSSEEASESVKLILYE